MTGSAIIRHTFKIERVKKVYSIYQLTGKKLIMNNDSQEINPALSELIRIEQFRHYSNGSGFDYYLRMKTTNNWQTSEQVTGLFKTKSPVVFYGDHRHNGRNLLIFKFFENKEYLTIDYYIGFCPYYRPGFMSEGLKSIIDRYV